jgi:hypothetical protein
MTIVCLAFLSFVLASLVATTELLTSKYPQTLFLLTKCRPLYVYGVIYGVSSAAVMVALGTGTIKLEGLGLANPLVQAIVAGVFTKAMLHIRFYNVSIGNESFPIGTESFVQLFEPFLLRNIHLYEFAKVREYVQPRAQKYNDLNDVKARVKADLPPSTPEAEKKGLEADIEKMTAVVEAMEFYLTRFGKANFNRVFPL